MTMRTSQQPVSAAQCLSFRGKCGGSGTMALVVFVLLVGSFLICAQTPVVVPSGSSLQLQIAQPAVDVTTPVTATAGFDPRVVRAGEKTFYRVNVDATESSVAWPDKISTPAELKFDLNARGMITEVQASGFRPLTTFAYEVETTAAGHYVVTNFTVNVSGVAVEIPAASLDVVAGDSTVPPARQLSLETSATNVFLGQPFRARVLLPLEPGNEFEALQDIQINGDGLMADKTSQRQYKQVANINGQLKTASVYEITVTPIAAGPQKLSAQGFTASREFAAPVVINGQVRMSGGPARYVLLVSDPVEIKVRPLPVESELPGFTGAIGKFFSDPPQLATNRLRVGEPVKLKITFHGEGDLTRFVPALAPRSRDWQIIADPAPATSFTLIPTADDAHETPAIPFSYFDPETGKYVDLTIPPLPVTVTGEGLPVELPAFDDAGKTAPIKLSALAATPGKTVGSLKPLQCRGWLVALQLTPIAGFLALWQWDRRRRYLEAHPEIVRRTRARRALRREKQQLQKAAAAGDAGAFVQRAARAMSIAVAPNFPADPAALVGGDVLAQLDAAARNAQAGETVRKVFAAADAQFAGTPQTPPDVPALRPGVNAVLQSLEEKL